MQSRPIPRWQRKTPGGHFFDVARQLVAVDKPVIAAIQGHAVGAGLAYALACDRRFGDTTTKMSAIFTSIGVAPDCGLSYFLPRVVGLPNALMMVETARMFKAEECLKLGLIDLRSRDLRKLAGADLRREPLDAIVRRMDLQDQSGFGSQGACVIARMGAVRGADLAQACPCPCHDLGHAERAADLDQLPAGDDGLPVLREGIEDEEHRSRIVVDEGRVLRARPPRPSAG